MINFREIFNPSYSYIGLIIIAILLISLIILEKKRSIKVIGYSCFASGIFLLLIYFIGNLVINNINYKFFIEIITNSFFSSLIVIAILNVCIGTISIYLTRYIEQKS